MMRILPILFFFLRGKDVHFPVGKNTLLSGSFGFPLTETRTVPMLDERASNVSQCAALADFTVVVKWLNGVRDHQQHLATFLRLSRNVVCDEMSATHESDCDLATLRVGRLLESLRTTSALLESRQCAPAPTAGGPNVATIPDVHTFHCSSNEDETTTDEVPGYAYLDQASASSSSSSSSDFLLYSPSHSQTALLCQPSASSNDGPLLDAIDSSTVCISSSNIYVSEHAPRTLGQEKAVILRIAKQDTSTMRLRHARLVEQSRDQEKDTKKANEKAGPPQVSHVPEPPSNAVRRITTVKRKSKLARASHDDHLLDEAIRKNEEFLRLTSSTFVEEHRNVIGVETVVGDADSDASACRVTTHCSWIQSIAHALVRWVIWKKSVFRSINERLPIDTHFLRMAVNRVRDFVAA